VKRVRTLMRRFRGFSRTGVLACVLICIAPAAFAGDVAGYPNRPIRIIVPFATGTWVDIVTRVIGDKLAQALGQTVVVENHPGASGSVGAELVAKSPPDGYTLLVGGVFLSTLPAINAPRAVDPQTLFVPVTRWTNAPILVVVNSSLKVATLAELCALARSQPGRLAYATSGVGTTPHLAAAMLSQRAGIDLMHVPYANTNAAVKDVLAGEVPMMMTFSGTVDALVRSGGLRVIAVTTKDRNPVWPDVPTVAEQGYPEFDVSTWSGAMAPIGTPPEVIALLHGEFAKILGLPDVRERIAALGLQIDGTGPSQFAQDMKADLPRWKTVSRKAGLRAD
jgi:tripartite-type tricarboxylate transporter receptor subunit TctC